MSGSKMQNLGKALAAASLAFVLSVTSACAQTSPTPPPPAEQPSAHTITLNPVQEYAKNLGFPEDLVYGLRPLGEDGVMDEDEKAFVDIVVMQDEQFANYMVENKLCIQDHKLTELEKNFLGDPSEHTRELFDCNLSEISKINPELASELEKLPDFKEIEIKDVEALEDILGLVPKSWSKKFFEDCVNDGIKDKRKYCSPLEALLWIAYDQDFDELYYRLEYCSLESLMGQGWNMTTTSRNYGSDRWMNFDEVVARLNSPYSVCTYKTDNIRYDWDRRAALMQSRSRDRKMWFITPKEVFERKHCVCSDLSRFVLYCLLENGYSYDDFEAVEGNAACILETSNEFQPIQPRREFVCLVKDNGVFYYVGVEERSPAGPFSTIEELAPFPSAHLGWQWREYRFLDLDLNITKTVPRRH